MAGAVSLQAGQQAGEEASAACRSGVQDGVEGMVGVVDGSLEFVVGQGSFGLAGLEDGAGP